MDLNEDPAAKKRRQANERKARFMAKQSQESLERIRAEQAASQRRKRQRETSQERNLRHNVNNSSYVRRIEQMSSEQLESQRRVNTLSQQSRINRMTQEQLVAHREAHAQSQHNRINRMTQEQLVAHREVHAQSEQNRIDRMTQEQLVAHREAHAQSQQNRINNMSPEQLVAHREAHAQSQQHYIDRMTQEQREAQRTAHSELQRQRIEEESPLEQEIRRLIDSEAHQIAREHQSQIIRTQAINFNESEAVQHNCGALNVVCQYCGSKNFLAERPVDRKFTACCRKGKVKLPQPRDLNGRILNYPDFLKELLSNSSDVNYKNFRENVRSYNSAISFASLGAKVVELPGRGPYIFKIHGQTYHRTTHIQPIDNNSPQFAQLYVIDSTQATEIRQEHAANSKCRQTILNQIDRFFRQNNRLAQTYQLMREIHVQENERAAQIGETVPLVSMVFRRDRQSDQRRYNAPTSNEIAMVFVNENGEPPIARDSRIYPKNPEDPNKQFVNLSILSPNMDPMTYALLFPYGEAGWQPDWQCESYVGEQRHKISMLQYKAALTAIRGDFNPILNAGKLTQQWLVDSYLQVEANNLNFIRSNQDKLRAEQYKGLADHVENMAQNINMAAGVPVILPSSFEGSPRNMRERCSDAMSIFAKFGAPDLFITFTANPSWPEIVQNLKSGEISSDRPDLVARVFKIKLNSLIEDVTKHGIFGKSVAHVYSIEFQKRGLPHAHILVTLRIEDKFSNAERIDRFISAEIPPESSPKLREIVLRCMLHGPCGTDNPYASCMNDGNCSKNFPKKFNEITKPNVNGYPLYRRRSNQERVQIRGVVMDNRNVVPYNPFLTLKYNAHINVEVCTSLRAIKYIYKYIFKGFDCANMSITAIGQNVLRYNEITNFIDCRYVSAPEAIWRLREYRMHDRSHAVDRLPIHLPNQQTVVFQTGNEAQALQEAQLKTTKLEAWFELNRKDPEASQFLYSEIPNHYIYRKGEWKKRQRGGEKIVGRMYIVSIKDEERFYLRMLILHVKGATSFQFLKIVNNIEHETFKAAAMARGLLETDEEWDNCLRDGGTYLMPKQLREMFAYLCCFCHPAEPIKLWEDNISNLTLDYMRNDSEEIAVNKSLHDINAILKQHGLSCAIIGLPSPTGNPPTEIIYNEVEEAEEAQNLISKLNEKQREAFDKIIQAVDDEHNQNRCFYLDGPGGSGKTFLYLTILSFIRGRGQKALPFATTGIAATLLKGGRTVHSGFKLPVPILDTSVSSMRLTSEDAQVLREANIIIIDEVTMLSKYGFRCIDKLLREVKCNNLPFGGIVLVAGGDFKQTLPVVPRGTRVDIIETCIKSSSLWRHFQVLQLTTNMRSEGQNQYNQWLLQVGNGTLAPTPGIEDESTINIPSQMIETQDLIDSIFGNLQQMSAEELSKRVIVAPTNSQTLEMNKRIIDMISAEEKVYYSADSVVTEDPNDTLNFPVEFLHDQTPSGMPPHVLTLKKGVIIMLLRNLNPKKGMCNGTRLIVEELARNFIKARIISECNRGGIVFIPRIDLAPSDTTLPFILKRRQFPVIPAYAITINKSQGQTFDFVGIDLQTPVFSHGQLYVALSRSRNSEQIKVKIQPNFQQGQLLNDERQFTKNVVFKEIL